MKHKPKKNSPNIDLVLSKVPLKFSITSKKIYGNLVRFVKKSKSIADLGCGCGGTIKVFRDLNKKAHITGIDNSQKALNTVRILVKNDKKIFLIKSDLNSHSFGDKKYDLVYCSQLLEHIASSDKLLENIYRSMKSRGFFVLSTVYKKKWAWYFYKNKFGERVLTSDHVNEYSNIDDLLNQLKKIGFEIRSYDLVMFRYPLVDPLIKWLTKRIESKWLIKLSNSKFISEIRYSLFIPIFGFYNIQIIAKKR